MSIAWIGQAMVSEGHSRCQRAIVSRAEG